jgi:hypothetical protein
LEALAKPPSAFIKAEPSKYIASIKQHVQSVVHGEAEEKRQRACHESVMALNYVPVVFEDQHGNREVYHVDPLRVRTFRRTVAEELRFAHDKRQRMLRRIEAIRQELPQPPVHDLVERLSREAAVARTRIDEPLVEAFGGACGGLDTLHVIIDVSPNMIQLPLIHKRLMEELPWVLEDAGVQRVTFAAIGFEGSVMTPPSILRPKDKPSSGRSSAAATLEELLKAADRWLQEVIVCWETGNKTAAAGAATRSKKRTPRGRDDSVQRKQNKFRISGALQKAMADKHADKSAALIITASGPSEIDLEACLKIAEWAPPLLQIIGTFGASSADPEPALQRLVSLGTEGSHLRLFFGPTYWSNFIANREKQLSSLQPAVIEREKQLAAAGLSFLAGADGGDGDVVSPKVLEMRLIERIMRELYVEEQCCEDELVSATRLLERSLVPREHIAEALQYKAEVAKAKQRGITSGSALPPLRAAKGTPRA